VKVRDEEQQADDLLVLDRRREKDRAA